MKKGNQTPTQAVTLPYRKSKGKEAAELYKESDVRQFLSEAKLAKEPGDIQNVDAVLPLSVSANRKLYQIGSRNLELADQSPSVG